MIIRSLKTIFACSSCLVLVFSGCVKPDPANPWSSKSASSGGKQGEAQFVQDVPESSKGTARSVDFEEETIRVRPRDSVQLALSTDAENSGLVFALARERAQAILMKAANDEHPLLRTNGFEGLEWLPDTLAELAPKGLSDENRAVRFVTAMAVGNRAVQGMAPYLEPLLLDSSDSVHASAIYALRAIGEPANPSPLAGFVMSDNPEIRANTYIVLGKLGNPSAIGLIRSSLGVGMQLVNPMRVKLSELQAADVLVTLGEESEVEPLRAALFAPVEQGELTILACELLGEIGDGQARAMLQRLLTAPGRQQRPLEIRVAAAKALFVLDEMPSPQLESVIMVAVASDDSRLRVQAASALGVVPGAHVESVLLGMLDDVDPLVATAAAASIARRSYKEDGPIRTSE